MASMGLYSVKPWFVRRLSGIEEILVRLGVGANSISVLAVLVSAAAGAAIAVGGSTGNPVAWALVPPLCFVRLALNALDGSIARRSGSDRPTGMIINEVGDRVSDAAMIGSLVFVATPILVVASLSATFVVSCLGVLAAVATGRRDNNGPVAKADRVGLIAVAALLASITASTVPFEIVSWVLIAGGVVTAVARIQRLRSGGPR